MIDLNRIVVLEFAQEYADESPRQDNDATKVVREFIKNSIDAYTTNQTYEQSPTLINARASRLAQDESYKSHEKMMKELDYEEEG